MVVRASTKYIVEHEEMICAAIETKLQEVKMPENVDRTAVILKLLSLNGNNFQKMLVGGQCWYLARVYGLITDSRKSKGWLACKEKLFTVARGCRPEVLQFMELNVGCDYSFSEMMDTISEIITDDAQR